MGKFSHPLYSRVYIAARRPMERMGGAEHRRELLDGLSGRVLEIGAGSGLNFAHTLDPVWARACAGCHINRDAVEAIQQTGFELDRVRRFDVTGWLVRPHVLGVARRPA